jgi:L-amino acid N-acyltransferase YncA
VPKNAPSSRFVVEQKFPRKLKAGGRSFTLREMGADDREAMVAFARSLPESDLLFLRMDITQPEIVDQWVEAILAGRRFTLLAEEDGQLAGYASLNSQGLTWTRHLADIRMIVDSAYRGSGLGGILAHEVFSVARDSGLTKVVAQMAREQEGAQKVFRRLGFNVESMLADWVIDREGRTHDLIVMSYDVTGLTDS